MIQIEQNYNIFDLQEENTQRISNITQQGHFDSFPPIKADTTKQPLWSHITNEVASRKSPCPTQPLSKSRNNRSPQERRLMKTTLANAMQ